MCWHFWKCKQMLWLWISTRWGLKSIHPLKSHCTKAFKSFAIQRGRRDSRTLLPLILLGPFLTSLTFALVPHLYRQPSCRSLYIFIYLSIVSHPLAGRLSVREERRKPAAQRASHKEQQLCASVVHDRWNRSWCSSEAPRYQATYCTTQRKKWQRHTHVRTIRTTNTKAHMDTYMLYCTT